MLPRAAVAFIVALASLAGRAFAQSRPVAVSGVAYDSLNRAPLAGARISIVGSTLTARADERGRFRFDSVPPGVHTIAAEHPSLDSLGFSGISARVSVTDDALADVRLGGPSFATLWRTACGTARIPKDSGFVYGHVRDAIAGTSVPNATVDITWIDLGVTRAKRITETRWRGRSVTNADGDFTICGVPTDVGLRIRAATDSAASGLIDLPPRAARVQRRDLLIGLVSDSAPSPRGTVAGLVADSGGRPIADARVIVDGVPELRADSAGRFTVSNVPVGSRQVELLAIGRSPVVTAVDVTTTDTAMVFATMRRITTLDVVRVTASRGVRRLVRALDERRMRGGGYVRDSSEVAAQGTLFVVFSSFPSVRAERTGAGQDFYVTLPASRGGRCVANLVIDGRRATFAELSFFRPSDIAAVEVYPRRMSAPMEFVRNDECGVVVVWSKWALAG